MRLSSTQLLLGILDKATLTLGEQQSGLSQTVVFLMSNLGGVQIADLMQGGMEFVPAADKPIQGLDEKVGKQQ